MESQKHLQRPSERGGARVKLLVTIVIFAIVIYAGYLYIPVAVDAYYFKDLMQNKVDMAVAQGYQTSWVTEQLKKSEPEYHVPENAVITPSLTENRIEVRAQFTRPISFLGFTYNYEFDHTAKSTAFLTVK